MALNKTKIKKSLFPSHTSQAEEKQAEAAPATKNIPGDSHQPKYMSYDVKLSILLTDEQLNMMDKVVKDIMKSRQNKKERITKNTVFRCLVDLLAVLPIELKNIPDEDELRRRMLAAIGM